MDRNGNNWCRDAKPPRRNRRRSVLKINIYDGKGLTPRVMMGDGGIGVRAGGARGAAAPPKFGQLSFFGQQEKFGQSQFLKKFPCFFFEEIDIFYFNLKSAW